MLEKITQKFKNEPLYGSLFILSAFLVLLFTTLFSFCILQSDDYSYSAYLKDGVINFLRLTKEHFISINGRALVHFFLQITLALPSFFAVVIKSAVLFAVGFLTFKVSPFGAKCKNGILHIILFYSLIMLSGKGTLKESVMWASGFFNYVFPACIVFFALFLHKKGSKWQYLFCALAGATTEQWGITAVILITSYVIFSSPFHKLKSFNLYIPAICALAGYATIFTSPATLSRITESGHATVTESLFDISRIAQTLFSQGSCIAIIIIFIIITLLTAFIKKGCFKGLYTGCLPLFLILLLPVHNSYTAAFLVFLCYLLLCAAMFIKLGHTYTGTLFSGALASILIMLPTNTFDARITFPCALLLLIGSINLFFELKISEKLSIISVIALLVMSTVAFIPSYIGFYKNSVIEKLNLDAIENAKETKILNYCIDYDKNYTVRQMFNDGWFYNAFISLYDLEDCQFIIESENSVTFDTIKTKGMIYEGDIYLPVRQFIQEKGGSLTSNEGVVIELNGKTLTYFDGIFAYKNSQGKEIYLNSDENRITDFYTLYIKLSVINEAFDLNIKAL